MNRFLFVLLWLILPACSPTPSPSWHWQQAETGLPRQVTVLAAAADPANPNRLWLGVYAPGGLARSDDGGQIWITGAAGLGDNPVFDLLFDPSGGLWAAARDGLFYSPDGGINWQPVDGLPAGAAFSLAADAAGRIYVGLDGAGIYRQTETGWQHLGPVIEKVPSTGNLQTASGGPAAILSLTVSPDGEQLYAGTAGLGLFASRDGGRTWVNTYADAYAPNLVLNPARPQTAVASLRNRLVRSYDGGQTWHTLPVTWAKEEVVSLLWAKGVLAAGTGQGRLYRSLDGGDTWLEGGLGQPTGGILDLAVAGQRLLAATWIGFYASDDGGATWNYLSSTLGSPHPNTLLTTAKGLLLGTRSGLYLWQPDTRRWVPAPGSFPPGGLASLAVDPSAPQILYAGTTGDGLYRSHDGGDNWQRVPALGVGIPAAAVDPKDNQRLYLLAAWERVYESRDAGQSWQARWDGLGDTLETVSLAVDPVQPLVYVGAEDRLYRSLADRPWELAAPRLTGQTILALLAQPRPPDGGSGSVLYIGATRGVYRSLDGGLTVQGGDEMNQGYIPPVTNGGPDDSFSFLNLAGTSAKVNKKTTRWGHGLENITITALLANPSNPADLLAGTAYAGVYQSLDWGFTWQPIGPAELRNDMVESLAWGPEGELFVASPGSVWVGEKWR